MAEARSTQTSGAAPDEPASDFQGLVSAIDRSPIAAPELAMAALDTVLAGMITREGATDVPLDAWAPRQADNVDIEILEWIASHVRDKRRKSSSLMTIAALLLGGVGATLAQSLATVVDLAA